MNWEEIKLGTTDKMEELLRLGPDLERVPSNRLPQHMPMPQDIIPLGYKFYRLIVREILGSSHCTQAIIILSVS